MLELTCNDFDIEVEAVGDLAVLRAVTDAVTINIPLPITEAAALIELLTPFVQSIAA